MKDLKYDLIALLLIAAVFVGAIFLYKWLFNTVMATGWPDWVKVLILAG